MTILAIIIVLIAWAIIRIYWIHNDRLKKLKITLNKISQLLNSNASDTYLYDVPYHDACGAMEWFFQIQKNTKPDDTGKIGELIKRFKAKENLYRPIKNAKSFVLQIDGVDYLINLSPYKDITSTLLEIEKVTSSTPLVAITGYANDYALDWSSISTNYRQQQNYICQNCGVDLSSERRLLHVHHKNRDKGDNREKNLIALCASCHKKQPYHEKQLNVPYNDLKKLNILREQQGLANDVSWD